jgi:hypothetical protein
MDGALILVSVFFVGRKATSTIKAVNRMTLLAHVEVSGHAKIREEVNKYKEESARVRPLSTPSIHPSFHPLHADPNDVSFSFLSFLFAMQENLEVCFATLDLSNDEAADVLPQNADVTYQVSHDSKTSAASHPAPAAPAAAVAAK